MGALTDLRVPGEDLTVRLPDPAWLSHRERLEAWRELRRVRNRLDAALCSLVGVIDREGSFELDGAPTVTSWLVAEGEPASAARSTVSVAGALSGMPATAAAFETGDLDLRRVRLLVTAGNTNPEVVARDEQVLVDSVGTLSATDTRRLVDYWTQAAAPESAVEAEQRAHELRRLHVSATWAGMVRIDGHLDREAGAVVTTALDTLTDPGNLDPGDTRSAPQRRADALVDLCRDYLDHGTTPISGGQRPHITLHVAAPALSGRPVEPCELDGAGVVTPQSARHIACDAGVTPLHVDRDDPPGRWSAHPHHPTSPPPGPHRPRPRLRHLPAARPMVRRPSHPPLVRRWTHQPRQPRAPLPLPPSPHPPGPGPTPTPIHPGSSHERPSPARMTGGRTLGALRGCARWRSPVRASLLRSSGIRSRWVAWGSP